MSGRTMTDGELLAFMGTDARRWAAEFLATFRVLHPDAPPVDEGWVIGWMANAIEAGRDAGRGPELPRVDLDADNPFAGADTPSELLGQLAGAASTCWTELESAGVFQSTLACDYVDAALERLIELGWA